MLESEAKKRAHRRLGENGGVCDGPCGEEIKRWTSKCVYDPVSDRCFCNKNECNELYLESPRCQGGDCEVKLLPGEGSHGYCDDCLPDVSADEIPPGLTPIRSVPMGADVPKDIAEAALSGPNEIFKKEPGFYQVGKVVPGVRPEDMSVSVADEDIDEDGWVEPPKLVVDGTDVTAEGAFRICAKHNREEPWFRT